MTDACVITRVTGHTTNPDTGVMAETTATVYSGKCRVQQRGAGGSRTDVGEASVVEVTTELQLPMSVTGVQVEDRVAVTASALDPSLTTRSWRVAGDAAKTHATARRLEIREVTS